MILQTSAQSVTSATKVMTSSFSTGDVTWSSTVADDGSSSGMAERRYWTLVLVVIPALTLFGNSLVVLSVWREMSLRTATNYFIVSLAVADIMVAVLVMPLAVYVEVISVSQHQYHRHYHADRSTSAWVGLRVLLFVCCLVQSITQKRLIPKYSKLVYLFIYFICKFSTDIHSSM